MSSISIRECYYDAKWTSIALLFRPLQWLMAVPSLLFLIMLLAMLFRPPDVEFYAIDRVAFLVLIFTVTARGLLLHRPWVWGSVTLPMLGLLLLALAGLLVQPFDAKAWSVFAAKWVVPFALYHLAAWIFEDAAALRRFEVFCWAVLAYLSFTSVCSLLDLRQFIFPHFVVDENIGIHFDRARGPFLQAVANGVTLNLLALMALHSFRRRAMPAVVGIAFVCIVPIAILATKTRSVWLSFAFSILWLCFAGSRRVRTVCISLALATLLVAVTFHGGTSNSTSLSERLSESSPVEFRVALYQAGWQMFLEKPVLGWSEPAIQEELERRISDFRQEAFYFHNTFLEIAVAHGIMGIVFYVWIVATLFRVRRTPGGILLPENEHFLDHGFRALWPLFLLVYLINASFVVMNYQFVNALLFTWAGLLTTQNRQINQHLALSGF